MAQLISQRLRVTPKQQQMFNAFLYIIGGIIFVIGSICFHPSLNKENENAEVGGVWLFIIGSVVYLVGATQDGYEVQKAWREKRADSERSLKILLSFELQNALLYSIGSVIFVIGSVLFFPRYGEKYERDGVWLFIVGSIVFLAGATVNVIDLRHAFVRVAKQAPAKLTKRKKTNLEKLQWFLESPEKLSTQPFQISMAVMYLIGSVMFIIGSVFFFPSFGVEGATDGVWLFIWGSFVFLVGGILNALKLRETFSIQKKMEMAKSSNIGMDASKQQGEEIEVEVEPTLDEDKENSNSSD